MGRFRAACSFRKKNNKIAVGERIFWESGRTLFRLNEDGTGERGRNGTRSSGDRIVGSKRKKGGKRKREKERERDADRQRGVEPDG